MNKEINNSNEQLALGWHFKNFPDIKTDFVKNKMKNMELTRENIYYIKDLIEIEKRLIKPTPNNWYDAFRWARINETHQQEIKIIREELLNSKKYGKKIRKVEEKMRKQEEKIRKKQEKEDKKRKKRLVKRLGSLKSWWTKNKGKINQ